LRASNFCEIREQPKIAKLNTCEISLETAPAQEHIEQEHF